MPKKPPNPDGNRGSFFSAPARRKHLTEDQARNASQHVAYMLNELETAVEHEDVPRETTCEKYDDHTFEDCERFLHTMQCTRCGIMVEHPAKWYREHPPSPTIEQDLPPVNEYE